MITSDEEVIYWGNVNKSDGCWEWTGWKNDKGYSCITFQRRGLRKTLRAHRISYTISHGVIPDGLLVDHRCFNRGCVNPKHLRLVTNKQNLENRSGSYSATGERNVYRKKSGHLYVKVTHNQKLYRRFGFRTIGEAAEAARQLRLELFTHNDLDRIPVR